ncbi:MAG: hypothetical protein ACRD82_11225 [Blastocatellia bacterium]
MSQAVDQCFLANPVTFGGLNSMTTITLELPDDLASQIDPLRNRLPHLLYEMLAASSPKPSQRVVKNGGASPVYQEVIDFLASGPTPNQIRTHRPSPVSQNRLAELLDKNREEELTEAEASELDLYEQVDDLMSLLKARARAANH